MEEFAKKELEIILSQCEDAEGREMQEIMNKGILEIIKVFSKQGHSGFSANYAIGIIEKLLRYIPLTHLTGADEEWTEVAENLYQNKRGYSVFKDNMGKAWRVDKEKVYIEFPYWVRK